MKKLNRATHGSRQPCVAQFSLFTPRALGPMAGAHAGVSPTSRYSGWELLVYCVYFAAISAAVLCGEYKLHKHKERLLARDTRRLGLGRGFGRHWHIYAPDRAVAVAQKMRADVLTRGVDNVGPSTLRIVGTPNIAQHSVLNFWVVKVRFLFEFYP